MNIYDISQEVFSCNVYPGDPMPEKKVLNSMEKGEILSCTVGNTSYMDVVKNSYYVG